MFKMTVYRQYPQRYVVAVPDHYSKASLGNKMSQATFLFALFCFLCILVFTVQPGGSRL